MNWRPIKWNRDFKGNGGFVREWLIKSKFYPEIIAFDIRDIFFFFFFLCKVKFLWNRNNERFISCTQEILRFSTSLLLKLNCILYLYNVLCFRNVSRVLIFSQNSNKFTQRNWVKSNRINPPNTNIQKEFLTIERWRKKKKNSWKK